MLVSTIWKSWCTFYRMGRITIDVNEEWLAAAREALGTETKVATINAALRTFALRKEASGIVSALDSVEMNFAESELAWGYSGGRDLSRLAKDAKEDGAVS